MNYLICAIGELFDVFSVVLYLPVAVFKAIAEHFYIMGGKYDNNEEEEEGNDI